MERQKNGSKPTTASSPLQDQYTVQGLRISIENKNGSVRHWKDRNGNEGNTQMRYDYGYIRGSRGGDGEAVDCYVGPNKSSQKVYIIDQVIDGKYDEQKVMLGFNDKRKAMECYQLHQKAPYAGSMQEMNIDQFKRQIARTNAQRIGAPALKAILINSLNRILKSKMEDGMGSVNKSDGPMNLYLIRHGKTAFNSEDKNKEKLRGWIDVPLDETGIKEACEIGERLKSSGIKLILSSDLIRAKETAMIISDYIGASVVTYRDLRPWNLGDFQGKEINNVLPLVTKFIKNPDQAVPNGESFDQFMDRYIHRLKMCMKYVEDNRDHLAIVGHYRNLKAAEAWQAAGAIGIDRNIDVMCADHMPTGEIIKWSLSNGKWNFGNKDSIKKSSIIDEDKLERYKYDLMSKIAKAKKINDTHVDVKDMGGLTKHFNKHIKLHKKSHGDSYSGTSVHYNSSTHQVKIQSEAWTRSKTGIKKPKIKAISHTYSLPAVHKRDDIYAHLRDNAEHTNLNFDEKSWSKKGNAHHDDVQSRVHNRLEMKNGSAIAKEFLNIHRDKGSVAAYEYASRHIKDPNWHYWKHS